MSNFFQDLSLETVFFANIIISIIGAIFIYGAPISLRYRNLKRFFFLFWFFLTIYYSVRVSVQTYAPYRIESFIYPWQDFLIRPSHYAWMWLVILADLPIFMLCLGYIFYFKSTKHSRLLWITCMFIVFIASWIYAAYYDHNAPSHVIALFVFLYSAWYCRVEHTTSSVLWITYALLHLPIWTLSTVSLEWRHAAYILLLVSKLSLIVAMYNMLEVRPKKNLIE